MLFKYYIGTTNLKLRVFKLMIKVIYKGSTRYLTLGIVDRPISGNKRKSSPCVFGSFININRSFLPSSIGEEFFKEYTIVKSDIISSDVVKKIFPKVEQHYIEIRGKL